MEYYAEVTEDTTLENPYALHKEDDDGFVFSCSPNVDWFENRNHAHKIHTGDNWDDVEISEEVANEIYNRWRKEASK